MTEAAVLERRPLLRHKWLPLRKTYGSNEFLCANCRLEKIGRFSGGTHWTEWRRDGKYIESEGTPPCQ